MNIDLIRGIAGLKLTDSAYIGSGQGGDLMIPYVISHTDGVNEVQNFETMPFQSMATAFPYRLCSKADRAFGTN